MFALQKHEMYKNIALQKNEEYKKPALQLLCIAHSTHFCTPNLVYLGQITGFPANIKSN